MGSGLGFTRALRSASGAAPSTASAHISSSVSGPCRGAVESCESVEKVSRPEAGAGAGATSFASSSPAVVDSVAAVDSVAVVDSAAVVDCFRLRLRCSNGLLNGFFATEGSLSDAAREIADSARCAAARSATATRWRGGRSAGWSLPAEPEPLHLAPERRHRHVQLAGDFVETAARAHQRAPDRYALRFVALLREGPRRRARHAAAGG